MFRRTAVELPADAPWAVSLAAHGLSLNSANQITKTNADADRFFKYYHTSDERTNDLRKDAVHNAVRKIVFDKLKTVDLHQVYLTKDAFYTERPDPAPPSINILTTDLDQLKKSKHVFIVVREHTAELGVWSWRMTMNEPGLNEGTALSLASIPNPLPETNGSQKRDSPVDPNLSADENLGIIILNPGELVWSNDHNKNMSLTSWNARLKDPAYQLDHRIDEEYNRVEGHTMPGEHVMTFLNTFLSKLTNADSNLYFVANGDGTESVMQWLNNAFLEDPYDPIKERIKAIALLQPVFQSHQITSQHFRQFCAHSMKVVGWSTSEEPEGKLLEVPTPVEIIDDPDRFCKKGMASIDAFNAADIQLPDSTHITSSLRALLKSKQTFDLTASSPVEFKTTTFCPTFSTGPENNITELMLPQLLPSIMRWFRHAGAETDESLDKYISHVQDDAANLPITTSTF